MKTLFKILVILVVAVLVGGMFYGVTSTSTGTDQSSLTERTSAGEFHAAPPDREDDAGGIQFPADAIKNLVIISVVSVLYLNIPKWLGRRKPTLKHAP
jgi:hypothetical protein